MNQREEIFGLILGFAWGNIKKKWKIWSKRGKIILSEGWKVEDEMNMKKKMEGIKMEELAENYRDTNRNFGFLNHNSWCIIIGGFQNKFNFS